MTDAAEPLVLTVKGDDANLTRSLKRAGTTFDTFISKVESGAKRLDAAIDTAFGMANRLAIGIDSGAGSSSAAIGALVGMFGRLISQQRQSIQATDDSAQSVNRLNRQYKAGLIDLESYKRTLEEIAATAKQGTDKEIAAQLTLKVMRDKAAADAKAASDREAADSKKATDKKIADAERVQKAEEAAQKRADRAPSVSTTGSRLSQAGGILTGVGMAAAAPIAASVAAYAEFQKQMDDVRGNTTLTDAQMNRLTADIKTLARETDQSTQEIATGAMKIANFGYTGADGMKILTAANEAAVASGADLSKVAEAVGSVMYQYKIPVQDAARVTNLLKYVSDDTNQTLADFVEHAGRGFEAASTLGIGLLDSAASMAILTKNGNSSAQSTTALRSIIQGIVKPSTEARKEIEALSQKTGIDLNGAFSAAGLKAYGLSGVLDMVSRATGDNADEIAKVFSASRTFIPTLTLLTTGHEGLKHTVDGARQAFEQNQRIQDQYKQRTKDVDFQLGQLRNTVFLAAASFGEKFAPQIHVVIGYLESFAHWLEQLSPAQKQVAVDALAITAVIGLLGGGLLTAAGKTLELVNGLQALTKLDKVVSSIDAVKTALDGASTAETAVATEGASAFAIGGPLALAILGITALVGGLAWAWWQVKSAQDAAAQSEHDYDATRSQLQASGTRGAYEAEIVDNVERKKQLQGDLKNTLDPSVMSPYADGKKLFDYQGKLAIQDAWKKAHPDQDMPLGLSGQIDYGTSANQLTGERAEIQRQIAKIDTDNTRLRGLVASLPKPGTAAPKPSYTPGYLNGGGGPKPTGDPDAGKSKGSGVPASVYSPFVFDDSDKPDVTTAAQRAAQGTDSGNYLAKIKDAQDSEADLLLQKRQQGANESEIYQVQVDALRHQIAISDNAIKSINSEVTTQAKAITDTDKAARAAAAQVNAIRDAYKAKGIAEEKITGADKVRLDIVTAQGKAAEAAYKKAVKTYTAAQRVLDQAQGNRRNDENRLGDLVQTQKKKTLDDALTKLKQSFEGQQITRAQFDASLRSLIAGAGGENADAAKELVAALVESEKARSAAVASAAKEIADLAAKGPNAEFDAKRVQVRHERNLAVANGTPVGAADREYQLKLQAIDTEQFDASWKKFQDNLQTDVDSGKSTIVSYRDAVQVALDATAAAFGQNSEQARKLTDALAKLDVQIAKTQIKNLSDAVGNSHIGLTTEIGDLQYLQTTVEQNSEAWKAYGEQIEAVQKQLLEADRRKAAPFADAYTSAVMQIGEGGKASKVIQDTLKKVFLEAVTAFVKEQTTKLIVKVEQASDKAAEAKQKAKDEAAAKSGQMYFNASGQFVKGVDTFGTWVQAFLAGLNGTSAGRGGTGSATSTGTGAATAANSTSGTPDQVGAALSAAATGRAADLVNQAASLTKNKTTQKDLSNAAAGIDAAGDAAKGDALGVLKTASGAGWLGTFAKSAMPWLAVGLGAATLIGSIFGQKHEDFTTHTSDTVYAQVGSGDHTGYIDSGYSGTAGMRKLQSNYDAKQPRNVTLHVHPGAITVNATPAQSPTDIASAVKTMIQQEATIGSALAGTD